MNFNHINTPASCLKPSVQASFSKTHTQIAKGSAILLMVFHHLFAVPGRFGPYTPVLVFNGINIEYTIAVFGKICVGIFLFLSGFGLYHSLISQPSLGKMYLKAWNKLLRIMINYWTILAFVFPIGLCLGFFSLDLHTVVGVITGLYPKVWEWWFLCQYVVLIMISPLIVLTCTKAAKNKAAGVAGLLAVYGVYFIAVSRQYDSIAVNFALAYMSYLTKWNCAVIFALGVYAAHSGACRLFVYGSHSATRAVNTVILILTIALRMLVAKDAASMKMDYIFAPLFVFSLTTVVYGTGFEKVLTFFARHSTNIWLTHTFWCYYFAPKIVCIPKYSLLIYIWLLVLSLGSSCVINSALSIVYKAGERLRSLKLFSGI